MNNLGSGVMNIKRHSCFSFRSTPPVPKNNGRKSFSFFLRSIGEFGIQAKSIQKSRQATMCRGTSENGRKSNIKDDRSTNQGALKPSLESCKKPSLNELIDSGHSVSSILENDVACVARWKLWLLKRIAIQKAKDGQWKTAHDMLQEILNYERKMLDLKMKNFSLTDHADTLYHLGIALGWKGKCESALEFLIQSLVIRRKALGDHHLLVAATHCGIGVTKGMMGDYEGAIVSLQCSQKIKQNVLGSEDKSTSLMIIKYQRKCCKRTHISCAA